MPIELLVIDDERCILELCQTLFTRKGYSVRTASSGKAGLRQIEELEPALVLLDYMMPVMDGMEVLKQIKNVYPDVYVIVFTGKGSAEVAVEVMRAGASDYISKPFKSKDLFKRIENVLHVRHIEMVNMSLHQERAELQHEILLWNKELELRVHEKSIELEQANREMIQSEKLATAGHLAAGLAHEIRNPLNSISLTAQLLQSETNYNANVQNYAQNILAEVERIDIFLRKMLNASKQKSSMDTCETCLHSCIDKALELFKEQIKYQKINLNVNIERTPVYVAAGVEEIKQVFTNLIGNALFQMKNSGTLSIDFRVEAGRALVHVGDTGAGIPKDNLGKIFAPFFTTKRDGTGLGLSVVLRAVKSCNGNIWVESELGSGADFYLEFPLEKISGDYVASVRSEE